MRRSFTQSCRNMVMAFSLKGVPHLQQRSRRALLHHLDALEQRTFMSAASSSESSVHPPILLSVASPAPFSGNVTTPMAPAGIVVDMTVGLYDRWVSIHPNVVSAAPSALISELEAMTGVRFDASAKTTGRGIFILLAADAASYPDLAGSSAQLATLATKTTEGFYIKSDGANSLYIVGNSAQAISHGVYFYLQQLGWRALLPGENWTVRPSVSAVTITTDQVHEPDFRMRGFFGTGGFGNVPLDPASNIENAWLTWQKENLLGGSIAIGGHAGEAFNTKYKTTLEAHPEYRPIINGVTQPWSLGMKPYDINPDFQALYVNDRVTAYNAALIANGPDSPYSYAVTVEPADGDGFSNDAPSLAFGSTSDHVFNLANLVAQQLQISNPGAQASLLAYNSHADVPDIDLEPNIYVAVTPYAFQRTDKTPDELLAAWALKHDNLGIYDYWNIPDWTNELPSGNVDTYLARIPSWIAGGYDSFQSESSFGAGSVGMLWYVASRLMWDTTTDIAAARQEFYDLSFGAAAAPMKRMIDRWSSGVLNNQQDIALNYQDINIARTMAAADPDPKVLARVNDYAKYVVYIQLYFEYQNAGAVGSPARHTAANNLLQYVWGIYDSAMVHSYRMNELIRNRYDGADTVLNADWNPSNAAAAGWASVTTVTDTQLTTKVNAGTSAYPVLFDQPNFSPTLTPVNPAATLDGVNVETPTQIGTHTFKFYAPTGNPSLTQINFQIACYNVYTQPDLHDTVTVRNSAGTIIFTQDFGANNDTNWSTFAVPVTPGESYTMTVADPKKSFRMRIERKLPLVQIDAMTSMNQTTQPAVYFYVPQGQTSVALAAGGALPLNVKNFSGTTVTPTYGTGAGLSIYPVASGQDGHIWSFTNLKGYTPGSVALSTPNAWAFSADGMMLPINTAPKVFADFDKAILSPTNSVSLTGKVVDDRMSTGVITSAWTKQSGPGTVNFSAGSNPITSATFSAAGTYVLRLTADDGTLGAFDEVTVVYNATAPNTKPVVNAGSDQTVAIPVGGAVATATLDGSVTDAGGGSLTYSWTLVSGPGRATIANPSAVDTSATFDTAGDYVLRLSVSDGSLDSFDEIKIKVKPDYTAPTYKIGDTGNFGYLETFTYTGVGATLSSINQMYDARFMAMENVSVNKVYQRLVAVDPNTRLEVGIMADDGNGNPTGIFLASTGSYDPADGNSVAWTPNFGSTVNLTAYSIYHVVTKVTAITAGESFSIYKSAGNHTIRPFDRGTDTYMGIMSSGNAGATWSAGAGDPYFVLGNGSGVVQGPGQGYQSEYDSYISTTGGTGQAIGQRFMISTKEVPANSRVVFSAITMKIGTAGSPTDPLIVKLKKANGDVIGQFTVTPALADNTYRTFTFDSGVQASLLPGESYTITTQFGGSGGTTGQSYRFRVSGADSNTGDATWGGRTTAVPLISGASNNWATSNVYAARDWTDLWFNFQGKVMDHSPVVPLNTSGTFGNYEVFNHNGVGQTLDSLNDFYSARFQPHENVTVDRLFQRFVNVDANTRIEVGIMADDGTGKPDGRFLVSTGSINPGDGNSADWALLTQPITLKAMGVYHLVTKATVLGAGDSFMVYRSSTNYAIRPYDKTSDPFMNAVTRTNGGAWSVQPFDPYFALGNGVDGLGNVNLAQGPGNVNQSTAYHLNTYGGTGTANGQRFKIAIGQAPQDTLVRTTGLTMQFTASGAPTASLLVQLRNNAGTVLGQFHVTPAQADGTARTWTFEGGGVVDMIPGVQYLITTAFDGASTTGQIYKPLNTYSMGGQGNATWGGTTDAIPITSGASNNWATWTDYTAREFADLWFQLSAQVLPLGTPQPPLSMFIAAPELEAQPPLLVSIAPTDPPKPTPPITSLTALWTLPPWPGNSADASTAKKAFSLTQGKYWSLWGARKVRLAPVDSELDPANLPTLTEVSEANDTEPT